jgi:hypothetical protein
MTVPLQPTAPVNLPDGWIYDKVYRRPASGAALKAAIPYAFDGARPSQAVSKLLGGLARTASARVSEAGVSPDSTGKTAATDAATLSPRAGPATGVAQPQGIPRSPEEHRRPGTTM